MQPSTATLVLVIALVAGSAACAHASGRQLQTSIHKKVQPTTVVHVPVSGGKAYKLPKGANVVYVPVTSDAGAQEVAQEAPEATAPAPKQQASAPSGAQEPRPTASQPAAPTSPAATLPMGPDVAGTNDIGQALSCQSAFNARGGRTGVEAALGDVCREGNSAFNALGCCQATAKLLNSGNIARCACNNLVYQQLCQEVKIQGLTCATLRPTLIGCGMQC